MRVLGVDPGKTGALVLTGGGKVLACMDMPVFQVKNSKAWFIDGEKVVWFVAEHQPHEVFVEMVSSRPGQGVSTSFQFGNAYGGVVAAISSVMRPKLVAPAQWKRQFGLVGTVKDATRQWCLTHHPDAYQMFKLKKHGGRADATMISHFGAATIEYAASQVHTSRAKRAVLDRRTQTTYH